MYNPLNHAALASQVRRQEKYAWNLESDIPWEIRVDPSRELVPLDKDAIFFPGASAEQRLAISQLMGLVINSTIAEMENVITRLKDSGWANILRSYPVNPEMWELGELFFQEEAKHAIAFFRFNAAFADELGIDPKDLDRLLPKAFGSYFLNLTRKNARTDGHSFWWTVASVEEVSIELFRQIQSHKDHLDPLFYAVHKRHMEEESRHHNYAFLMLDVIDRRATTFSRLFHRKTDLLFSQIFSTGWLLAELHRVFDAAKLQHKHPFFKTVASALPLMNQLGWATIAKRLFRSSPYISLVINTRNHDRTMLSAQRHNAWQLPFPQPITPKLINNE